LKTLGISYSGQHDTACALVIDGELIYSISEERLSRIKQDSSFPIKSIGSALDFANLKPEDIDYVVIGWSPPQTQFWFDLKLNFKTSYHPKSFIYTLFPQLHRVWIKGGFRRYEQIFGKSKFLFCPHHLAHALSAFCFSGFDESTILIADGRGAFEATSIWYAKDNEIIPVEITNFPNSLGLFYAKFTQYLGFKPLSDEWKVMGLAPYGDDGIDLSSFITQNEKYKLNWKILFGSGLVDVKGIENVLGEARNTNDTINSKHKDIAFAVQRETEIAMTNLAKYSIDKTGCNNLCLAGGVALNCKANGLIANSEFVNKLFIQPAASDEGAALGAAMYPYLVKEKYIPKKVMNNSYLGPNFDSVSINKLLKDYKLQYTKLTKPSETIAELLDNGNIIGLFQGRMEFGPRALGNRSIIADPRKPENKDKVNSTVKYRENWRPFAPSILKEKYDDYFDAKFDSPFMILSFPVRDEMKSNIPAATHIDGTARPQSVDINVNSAYWNIINEFYKLTGVPAVLNTSFNLKGEPIVCTPYDAIRTFYTSGLDYLLLEDFLISKRAN